MELTEIKGVGSAIQAKLNEEGVETVEQLAASTPDQFENVSESKAEKLIRRASRSTILIQSGAEARQENDKREYVTSGMEALDEILGGGFKQGHIVGVSGPPSTGKTQVVFQALGEAYRQTGKPSVYIETERDRFDTRRIAALSGLDEDVVEENVYRLKAYSLEKQRESYAAVREEFSNAGLVAVDSFTARIRLSEQFEGRQNLPQRSHEFVKHLNGVERMVEVLDCPVLLTLQVMGNPSPYGGSTATYGSMLMDHTLTYKIKMEPGQGNFKKARLMGHPSQAEDEVLVAITDSGLEAHREG